MSGDYPILMNGNRVLTSEHLYQALKFPNNPEIQKNILSKPSPIACKMIAKKTDYKKLIRQDWKSVQIEIMEFCLKTKLVWNWVKFGNLLQSTEGKTIYEISSKKDKYWGVVSSDTGFVGENHMGKLLMKLRDEFLGEYNDHLRNVTVPTHLNLRFLGEEIAEVDRRRHLRQTGTQSTEMVNQIRP